jgi:hypothetical protein
LLAASAEKAVLRIIAAESANFVTLDMVLSLVCAPQALRRHTDMINKGPRYSRWAKIGASLSDNFLING